MTGARRRRLLGGVAGLLGGALLALALVEGVLWTFPRLLPYRNLKREELWRRTRVFVTHAPDGPCVHSPDLGWDLRPGVRGDGLTINAGGLRGLREYGAQPPPGVRRILTVGDSFMFGEHLRDEETLPAQLEKQLNRRGRWEVLNLGVPGYGTDQQWLRLQRLGFQYGAHVVVLGFFEEDARRNILSFRDYAKPVFELRDGRLVLRNVPVPSPEELLKRPMARLPCRLRLLCAAELIQDGLAFDYQWIAAERTPTGRVTLAILDAMREAILGRGMHLVLLPIPIPRKPQTTTMDVRPREPHRPLEPLKVITAQPTTTEDLLVRWAARTQTTLVNARLAYLALPETDRNRLFAGHWTPYGAAVTARLLADRIAAGLPIPAAPIGSASRRAR